MKGILLTAICSLVFSGWVKSQSKNNERRLTFFEAGAYFGNGAETTNFGAGDNTETIGNTVGLMAYMSAPYFDDDEPKKIVLGWNFNVGGGWNIPKQKAAQFNLDIGFWASKILIENIEVGIQYSFLGIYSYQNTSFAGSSIQPAVRIADFQLTYNRAGAGYVTGCIKPKYPVSNANSIDLKYFIGKKLFIGTKYTEYLFTKEYTVTAGLTSF